MKPLELPASDLAWVPVAITVVRGLRQWSQKELAIAMGVDPSRISRLETGDIVPQPTEIARLCRALGISRALFKRLVRLTGVLREALGDEQAQVVLVHTLDLAAGVSARVRAVVEVGAVTALTTPSPAGGEAAGEGVEARNEALWQRLQPFPPKARQFMVRMGKEYQTTSFCLHLCDKSEQVAGHAADEALAWARLAREVAQHAPEEAPFRRRLDGLALGFWASVRRVKGKLRSADEAFARARAQWEAGSDPAGRLPGWRLDDLEASLRIEQDRFEEALALLERALVNAPSSGHGGLYIQKAYAQEAAGDSAAALATLEQARAHIDPEREPNLDFARSFNVAGNLIELGRAAEARALFPQVRQKARRLGADLHLLRVRWLEGRIAAGLGELPAAITALEEVRAAFTTRQIAYDTALATLELATLYLETGRPADVLPLATEAAWILKAEGVRAETLAAVRLFYDAAAQNQATLEEVRELHRRLRRGKAEAEV